MRIIHSIKNRLFQLLALYIPGATSTRVWLQRKRGVKIGHNVFISTAVIMDTEYPERISIGNNVTLGIRSTIIAHFNDQTENGITVKIEDEVYIGPGVIILPNVTIGKGSVISAGSVIKTSIPPKSMVAGNPARIVAVCEKPLAYKRGISYKDFIDNLKPLKSNKRSTN
jgi:acetyltransferase-like isoleucine patch superfamily enzyme